ncbi:MAG TPA: hypothetical protein PLK90_08155 [Clostridiales bacterium]|nr:hypothetical protein [Clostridiales bacterium]HQP70356.1 hypothetical protein [Clostridiales bacterium]
MSKFFNYKNPHEVAALISFLLILASAIFALSIPNSVDDYKERSTESKALNLAATVAQTAATYYSNSNKDSTKFIGLNIDYGKILHIDKGFSVQLPEDYRCEILDSIVVVTHRDGAKGEVRWR